MVCTIPRVPLAEAQRLPYYATYCPTRLFIHSMCTSHYLDIFITFIICLNVVTMSLEHYNQPTVSPSPVPGLRFHGEQDLSRTPLQGQDGAVPEQSPHAGPYAQEAHGLVGQMNERERPEIKVSHFW